MFDPVHMSMRDQSALPLYGFGGLSGSLGGSLGRGRSLRMAPPRKLYKTFNGLGAGEAATAQTTSEAYKVEIGEPQMKPPPSTLCKCGYFVLGLGVATLGYFLLKRK